MTLVVKTPPQSVPVDTASMKDHLRVTHSNDDTFIDSLISVAVDRVEQFTGRQLMPATWELYLDAFPDDEEILIRKAPVSAVSEIAYTDEDGAEQVFGSDNYEVDLKNDPVRIRSLDGVDWPSTDDVYNAVKVTFTAGYADADSVPDALISAIKLIVSRLYNTRMDSNMKNGYIKASENLMLPYKITR
jgi:uncharacterized phiE125 gp8 family phage protein